MSTGASALSPPRLTPRASARGRRRSAAPLSYLEAQEIHPALPALGPRTALLPPPLGRATSRSAPLLSSLGVSVNGVSHAFGKFRGNISNITILLWILLCHLEGRIEYCPIAPVPYSRRTLTWGWERHPTASTGPGGTDGNNENSRQAAAQERKQDLDFVEPVED